jgi:hypothetical protein
MLLANMPKTVGPRAPVRMTYQQLMMAVSTAVSDKAREWQSNQNPQFNSDLGNPRMPIFSVPAAR